VAHYTGIPLLDGMLGSDVPSGVLFVEGTPGSGVTSLALSVLREHALRTGERVAYIDAASDMSGRQLCEYAGPKSLLVYPYSAEAALDSIYHLLNFGVRVIALDTIDSLIPSSEMRYPIGEPQWEHRLRMLYHGLRAVHSILKRRSGLLVVTAQVRRALYSSFVLRSLYPEFLEDCIDTHIQTWSTSVRTQYGIVVWKTIKVGNKRECVESVEPRLFGRGLSRSYCLLEALLDSGVIKKKGSRLVASEGLSWGSVRDACRQLDDEYASWWGLYQEKTQAMD
jgi:RecA/RadA recombinase